MQFKLFLLLKLISFFYDYAQINKLTILIDHFYMTIISIFCPFRWPICNLEPILAVKVSVVSKLLMLEIKFDPAHTLGWARPSFMPMKHGQFSEQVQLALPFSVYLPLCIMLISSLIDLVII